MQNQLECYSNRHGNSNYYDLEFTKRVNIHNHPLLTSKIEQLSSILKNDHLKFILDDKGNISILKLEADKYVLINQNEIDNNAAKIIKSISKIAKKMDIASLKNEHFKPVYEAHTLTFSTFGPAKPVSEPSFTISNFIKNFRKLFATQLVIKPLVRKAIEKNFKNKSPEQLSQMYVNNEPLFSSIKEKIIKNNFSAFDTFEPEELETLFNNIFLESYKERLNETTPKDLFNKKIYNLDVARIITRMQHYNVSKNEYKKLLTVSPLDVPIEELAKISVTTENKKLLSQLWCHLIGNLFAKGNLEKLYPGNKEHQTQYALAYSEARSKLPKEIQKKLKPFIKDLDAKRSETNVRNFAIQNSNPEDLYKICSKKQIQLYNKINKEIDIAIEELNWKSAIGVTESLTYFSGTNGFAVKTFETLTKKEKLILSENDIQELYYLRLQKTAATVYSITEFQLENFRAGRDKRRAGEISMKELFEYMYDESALNSLKDKVSDKQFQAYKDLTFISKLVDSAKKKISPEEKLRFSTILNNLNANSEIKDFINKYLTNEEIRVLDRYLDNLPTLLRPIANKILNPKGLVQNTEIKVPYGISADSIKLLSKQLNTFNSIEKNKSEYSQLILKAQALVQKFQNDPQSIQPKEKLTVEELGKLNKLKRNLKDLGLEKLDQTTLNKNFKESIELINKSAEVLGTLENLIKPLLKNHYRTGDLLAYNGNKKEKWHSHHVPIEQKLTAFFSGGLTHGGKLFKENGKILISHLVGDVMQEDLDLYNLCISDIYEINISSLVSPQMIEPLQKQYGSQWQLHINKIYVESEKKLHSIVEEKFEGVENEQGKRTLAALANFPRIAGFFTGLEIQGHKKENESSFKTAYNDFFGTGPKNKIQICSEWASKATLAAMMETNRLIADELDKKTGFGGPTLLKKFDKHHVVLPPDVREYLEGVRRWGKDRAITKEAEKKTIKLLKENNYSKDQIELIIRIGNKEIFDLPYDRRERLKAIHPGRMVKLLDDKNCLRKRELPTALTQLVATD